MDSERKASLSTERVDYMSVYSSDLVAAVRKASGNTGNNMMGFIGKLL